jgi:vancomycin permeability regulator SanA
MLVSYIAIKAYDGMNQRVKADCIIVFGAKLRPNGEPTPALRFRVMTAIELYKQNYANKLICSGRHRTYHPGEPEALRTIALKNGVLDNDIILDKNGNSTYSSIQSLQKIMKEYNFKSVLTVSHGYHLARITLLCQRAGITSYPVKAESPTLEKETFYYFRECIALIRTFFIQFL